MFNGNNGKRYIYEEDILKQLYDFSFEYEYINIFDEKHISEIIMKILLYCSEHPIVSENKIQEKNIQNNFSKKDIYQNFKNKYFELLTDFESSKIFDKQTD